MLDIQTVAQNRYPEFFSQPRWVTKPILFLLKQLSQEKKLITLQSEYSQEPGLQFVDRLLHVFDFKFKLTKKRKRPYPPARTSINCRQSTDWQPRCYGAFATRR